MLEFLDGGIIPYVNSTRAKLELPEDQVALGAFDAFAAHWCSSSPTTIFTSELHPLDHSINSEFKALMIGSFCRWYVGEITDALDNNQSLSEIQVDLRTCFCHKASSCQWAITSLQGNTSSVVIGFEKAGIADYVI
jgi:hypothetical protein